MYKNGELDRVMESFEKTISESFYVSGDKGRSDMVEIEINGRYAKRYTNNNYYNNGQLNQMFNIFLHGYAAGKCEERLNH